LREVPVWKPIYIYHFGDHDPSGLDIDRDFKSRLAGFLPEHDIRWIRLGVTDADFNARKPNGDYELIGFLVKRTAQAKGLWRQYLDQYPDRCVEVDALPTAVLRQRCRDAIKSHIDEEKWKILEQFQECELAQPEEFLGTIGPYQEAARAAFRELIDDAKTPELSGFMEEVADEDEVSSY
jgi:hypothetical protein